ncbi:MAG: hypothetical protein AAFQ98_03080 [Bacteroidota bacterium]
MKAIVGKGVLGLLACLFFFQNSAKAQVNLDSLYPDPWAESTLSISFSANTVFFLASPFNVSVTKMFHQKRHYHVGFMAGGTMVLPGFVDFGLGGHAALVVMGGRGDHHLDAKLGVVYTPLTVERDGFKEGGLDFPLPVVSLGYRYQPPESNRFYWIGLSTAGLGFSVGFVLDRQH